MILFTVALLAVASQGGATCIQIVSDTRNDPKKIVEGSADCPLINKKNTCAGATCVVADKANCCMGKLPALTQKATDCKTDAGAKCMDTYYYDSGPTSGLFKIKGPCTVMDYSGTKWCAITSSIDSPIDNSMKNKDKTWGDCSKDSACNANSVETKIDRPGTAQRVAANFEQSLNMTYFLIGVGILVSLGFLVLYSQHQNKGDEYSQLIEEDI